jgi:Uma2 family endonuclease
MVLSHQPDRSALALDNSIDLDVVIPPTDLESNEPPLESTRHLKQLILLLTCLERLWSDRNDFFVGGNLTIYYNLDQLTTKDFRGPDLFVVLDTERRDRKSWMVWMEGGKYPNLILELLSDSTASIDRGVKKQIYQDIFRTPEYFWFHPDTLEFKGFRLGYQSQYEEIVPNERGWRWSQEVQLYLGIENRQLRWFSPDGQLVPTPQEAELQERLQLEAERQRSTQAQAEVQAERQRTEVERQRAAQAQAQAEVERQRAAQAQAQAQAERQRATQAQAQAEAEREQMETLLRRLQQAGINPDQLPQ